MKTVANKTSDKFWEIFAFTIKFAGAIFGLYLLYRVGYFYGFWGFIIACALAYFTVHPF